MTRKVVSYILVFVGILMIFMNLYISKFNIDKETILRIVTGLLIAILGALNIIKDRKNEN